MFSNPGNVISFFKSGNAATQQEHKLFQDEIRYMIDYCGPETSETCWNLELNEILLKRLRKKGSVLQTCFMKVESDFGSSGTCRSVQAAAVFKTNKEEEEDFTSDPI